MDFLSI